MLISIIIPNFNGAKTLHKCLEAATSLEDEAYEVIVVDDGSQDNSVEIIEEFDCRLVRLEQNCGTSHARNMGAKNSRGDLLFFTDSDCVLPENTLGMVRDILDKLGPNTVLGGTYTIQPHDDHFFSRFQSVYIHYSETKHSNAPDYLASHALVIDTKTFNESGGFAENFLPILEDVEFSHRLRQQGKQLCIEPEFQVQHIFNYSLFDSLRNAIRKTRYWVTYSLTQQDVFADSGTASHELKNNVASFFLSILLVFLLPTSGALFGICLVQAFNLLINRNLLREFYNADGSLFAIGASLYYLLVYPIPVGVGIVSGIAQFFASKGYRASNRKVLD